MPKNIRDIIPAKRASTKNSIAIPLRRVESANDERPLESMASLRPKRRGTFNFNLGGKKLWLSVVILGLVVVLGTLSLMNSATLSYTPKTATLAFAGDSYTAKKSVSGAELAFSVIKVSLTKSLTVSATGEETVEVKATGLVMVYNEQSIQQTLVKTTRLETALGQIYRIQKDVVVPAKGSLEVEVVADKAGAEQNIGLSDFTLPGLKGTPRFALVYGRSKTTITGGFVGSRKKVSEADLTRAKVTLEKGLKEELLAKAKTEIPADYVLFPDLSNVVYTLLPQESVAEGSVSVGERGDLNAAIFKQADLAQYLAVMKLGANNVGSQVEILDFSKLNLTLAGDTDIDLNKVTTIQIKVAGTAPLRFLTDESSLASDLLGVSKANVDTVLKKYPSIAKAHVVVRPFWESIFPNDASKIKIERTD